MRNTLQQSNMALDNLGKIAVLMRKSSKSMDINGGFSS
jgi:hypothetical protein